MTDSPAPKEATNDTLDLALAKAEEDKAMLMKDWGVPDSWTFEPMLHDAWLFGYYFGRKPSGMASTADAVKIPERTADAVKPCAHYRLRKEPCHDCGAK